MKLSIVIPVFNEERTLATLIGRVLAVPYEKELIIVDDASTDGSSRIMEELAARHPGLRLIRHAQNRGKGAALATGLRQVTGDIVLIQDADLEYDPADYPALLKPLEDGHADVVFGSRFLGGPFQRVHLYHHYLGNRFLTALSNLFTNLNLTDMETCYKVFRREVADKLDIQSRGFAVEPEITAKVARLKVRVYEVPIRYAGRDYAAGKKIRPRDGFIAVWAIVRWGLFK